MDGYVMALDQGTTSSRAMIFSASGEVGAMAQVPFPQHYPKPGWVEHDPMEILDAQYRAMEECLQKSGLSSSDLAGLGITNQRETSVVWEKKTGRPVYNAIVWQCRRTADLCARLISDGLGDYVKRTTGLLVDAYFSGTKYRWILDAVPGARARAERGELLCGTVDSWLIWNLTGGRPRVRFFQLLAHHALRYRQFALGRGPVQSAGGPNGHAAPARSQQYEIRRDRPKYSGLEKLRRFGVRRGGRPAGRPVRAGVL
jgi:glycerol kinase